jgi:hypothetical protein
MAYLGKTLETASGFTIDVVRQYLIECSDCGPIDTHSDGYSVPETRADALKAQQEHHAVHESREGRTWRNDG